MTDKTALGDRMKGYESAEAGRRAMPLLPLMVRLDGKCFSSWTRGLARPFDERLSGVMQGVTRQLVVDTGALVGYTQSDEISLVLYSPTTTRELPYAAKFQKITSILAASASVYFKTLADEAVPEKAGAVALFDCRAWTVPTKEEAANAILWRERDATKNSLSMAAGCYYSHAELMGKSGAAKHDMLHAKGVNWNDYPAAFKRGSFIQGRTVSTPFTVEEIDALPEKHHARSDPSLTVERRAVCAVDVPPFDAVTNRAGFIFEGEAPAVAETA